MVKTEPVVFDAESITKCYYYVFSLINRPFLTEYYYIPYNNKTVFHGTGFGLYGKLVGYKMM
jgi:hypothetical protein